MDCNKGSWVLRRPESGPSKPSLTPEKYLFIDGLDASYSGSVRAHVLQKYAQKRKIVARRPKRSPRKPDNLKENQKKFKENRSAVLENEEILESKIQPRDPSVERHALSSPSGRRGSLCLPMGHVNYALDALGAYHKDLSEFEKRMVHYYSRGDQFFYNSTTSSNFCPSAEFGLKVNLSDSLIITVMIAYASARLENLGVYPNRVKSLKYMARSYNELSSRLRPGRLPATSIQTTIIALCGIWNLFRERPLNTEGGEETMEAETHAAGIRNLIILGGGWDICCSGLPWLSWLLHWTDICTFGALSFGITPSRNVPRSGISFASRTDTEKYYVEEFADTYQKFYLTAVHKTKLGIKALQPEYTPFLDLLQPTAYTFPLLIRDQHARFSSLTVALYANIVESTATLPFASHLNRSTFQNRETPRIRNLNDIRTVEPILWNFMTNEQTQSVNDSECAHLLSRLLWVEARISREYRERLVNNLLNFVSYGNIWPDALKDWWTPEEFSTVVRASFKPVI